MKLHHNVYNQESIKLFKKKSTIIKLQEIITAYIFAVFSVRNFYFS